MVRTLVIGSLSAALLAGAVAVPAIADENPSPAGLAASSSDPAAVGETQAAADAEADAAASAAAAAAAARREARQQARARREAAQRRAARQARDMVGVEPSLYRGRYFVSRHESIRRCIVRRESMGQYRVVNRSSSAAGAYQFLLSTSNYVARKMHRRDLIGVPASRWNRLEQDQAFWTLWDHGRGRGHWAGGRWSC